MRAIHLNYHEVTKDPRVLKECNALAARGVKVEVICALEEGAPSNEQVGDVSITRIDWMSPTSLNRSYLEDIKEFPHTYSFVEPRLSAVLDRVETADKLEKLEKQIGILPNFDKATRYGHLRGMKRWREKWRMQQEFRKVALLLSNADIDVEANKPNSRKLAAGKRDKHRIGDYAAAIKKASRPTRIFHSDVYQACSFLFDANTQKLDIEGPVDIVHAHDIYTLPAGVRLARATGAKLIYDAHEYEVERASKMPPEGCGMAEAIERDCFEHVDALITVSQGICDLYARRFSKREPVLVLNAPEISKDTLGDSSQQAGREEFRRKLGLPENTPLISYTGWVLREQRGVDQVVRALQDLPGFHLIVLGPRNEQHDGNLIKIATDLGVSDRVHLLPPVYHSEVVPTIRNCDVAVIPFQDSTLSYRYAMPNKLFEAVFSGLPVAVADLPDMSAFVQELRRGEPMDATDPKAIARTIGSLYRNKSEYVLSADEYSELIRNYSWSAQASKLHSLYLELAG